MSDLHVINWYCRDTRNDILFGGGNKHAIYVNICILTL